MRCPFFATLSVVTKICPFDLQNTYDVLSELSHTSSESDPFAAVEIYNPEDPDYHQTCEVKSCKGDVFMNLSFHKPKKDQCGLCKCYREGSEEVKANLEKEYLAHILEKETVREIKNSCKEKAKNDTKVLH
ncbi:unnamed protein product [Acanthoscelides obtectus]|uniref:Uncharacterized protein n=1 Tax=Acanthoscelides obtectus TaxID=200917 RepID=A0A9P0KAV2_ACAOB|nr:unnamed protein product [Acanthoscelides obtectus]CAK1632318.1 hypothetical protein AOBTE_LOCUS7478 [Acanthoscelides obtectus]